jgi:hypothetical protein
VHLHVSLNVCVLIIIPRLNFLRNVSLISGQNFVCISVALDHLTLRDLVVTDIQRRNVTYKGPCNVIFSILLLLSLRHCFLKRTQPLLTISYSKWPSFISVKTTELIDKKNGSRI